MVTEMLSLQAFFLHNHIPFPTSRLTYVIEFRGVDVTSIVTYWRKMDSLQCIQVEKSKPTSSGSLRLLHPVDCSSHKIPHGQWMPMGNGKGYADFSFCRFQTAAVRQTADRRVRAISHTAPSPSPVWSGPSGSVGGTVVSGWLGLVGSAGSLG